MGVGSVIRLNVIHRTRKPNRGPAFVADKGNEAREWGEEGEDSDAHCTV